MPKYVSDEKRADIIQNSLDGANNKDIAKFARVTVRTVERILKEYRETGTSTVKVANCGRKSVISEEYKMKIIEKIEEQPDITLLEIIRELDLNITESGLSKWLKKQGFTYKKKQLIQQSKTAQMYKKNAKNSKKN